MNEPPAPAAAPGWAGPPGPVVTVPAETELPARLVGRLTVRAAGWLALSAAGAAAALLGRPDGWRQAAGAAGLLGGLLAGLCRPGGRPLAVVFGCWWGYRWRRRRGTRAGWPEAVPRPPPGGHVVLRLRPERTGPFAPPACRVAALAGLRRVLAAATGPVQARSGPVPTPPPGGSGAAGVLAARLAVAARRRGSELMVCADPAVLGGLAPGWFGDPGSTPVPTPAVPLLERAGQLRLADGRCGRVLAVRRWPPAAPAGWPAVLAGADGWLALHLHPLPAAAGARLLRRRVAALESTAEVDRRAGATSEPDLLTGLAAARKLWAELAAGRTALFRAQLLVGFTAADGPALDRRSAAARAAAAGLPALLTGLPWQQQAAWAALGPAGRPLSWPWRLVDLAAAAATVPAPVGPTPTTGVLVGADPVSGAPVAVDRFGLHNANRLVVGTSGAGKSYAAKLEVARQLSAGRAAVVVDPEGEFHRLAAGTGGLVVTVGAGPAGLDPVALATSGGLPAAEGCGLVAGVLAALAGRPLTAPELVLLDRALAGLRRDGGADLPALAAAVDRAVGCGPPDPTGRPGPAAPAGGELPLLLATATTGSLATVFTGHPGLTDPPPLVVFDLRSVPDRARPAVTAAVLAWTWRRSCTGPRLLVVDEAHLLLDDPAAAGLLAAVVRRARKYRVGVEVLTQRLGDLTGRPAGRAVLANTATKLLLGCEDHDRAAVAGALSLTPAETEQLQPGRPGRGLLVLPDARHPVQVCAHPVERLLAGTGPGHRPTCPAGRPPAGHRSASPPAGPGGPGG